MGLKLTGDPIKDRQIAHQAYVDAGGNKSQAARDLGVSRHKVRWLLDTAPPPESTAEERAERAALKDQIRVLKRKLEATELGRYNSQRVENFVEQALEAPLVVEPEPFQLSAPSSEVVVTSILSDIEYGEVIDDDEVFGLNKYDRNVARRRLERYFEGVVRISEEVFATTPKAGVFIAALGDFFSGGIHEELAETDEPGVLEALLEVRQIVAEGLALVAREIGAPVRVAGTPGNHGRLTKRPRHKKRAALNLDWFLVEMLRQDMPRLYPDLDIRLSTSASMDQQVVVSGHAYHLTHGDQVRGGTGAVYGRTGPMLQLLAKRRRWAQATGNLFDTLLIGHWHTTHWLPGLIANGSIKGFSEYNMGSVHEYEAPSQVLWLTHPKWGPQYLSRVEVG